MKKKVILGVAIIAIIAIIGCIFLFKGEKYTIITLDINPSLELKVDKNDNVVEVTALNDDAKALITDDYKNKPINEVLDNITEKIIENVDTEGRDYVILVHVDGKISDERVSGELNRAFEARNIPVSVIVPKVTKEDEKKAKELGVTPAKAAFLKEVTDSNGNLKIEDLKDKPVGELNEIKSSGKYCDPGYTLDDNVCIKEKERVSATKGEICPFGYVDYEGKCYEEGPSEETGNLVCRDEFTLEGNECFRRRTVNAIVTGYTCSQGEVRTKAEVGDAPYNSGPANDPVCIDPSKITKPVTPCGLPASDPTERMSSGGKCYWHRAPVIESGCPGKIQVNGECWDDASGVYLCPNSKNSNTRSKDDNCYVKLNVKPTPNGYRCDEADMRLEGTKCVKEEKEPAEKERACSSGYTLVNHDRCINKNKSINKESGYICDMPDSRLKDDKCIIYERVEAKVK